MRRHPSGKISIGGILLALVVIAAGYWSVLFLPVYLDHWAVKDAVNKGWNAYGIVNDHIMRAEMEASIKELKGVSHKEIDVYGKEVEVQGLPVTPDNPLVELDQVTKTLTVTYRYDRTVHLIPSEKIRVLHFVAQKKGKYTR